MTFIDDCKLSATQAAETTELTDDAFADLVVRLDHRDQEAAHINGDAVLIALVRRLGYTKTADAWEKLDKWYA